MTRAGMTFCFGIITNTEPQEGTGVNSRRDESRPGIMYTPPYLKRRSAFRTGAKIYLSKKEYFGVRCTLIKKLLK